MKAQMHEIKAGQLNYYRKPLEELEEKIKETVQCLNQLEGTLESITNSYATKIIKHSIYNVSKTLQNMQEVYNLRIENPSVSDKDFLIMAFNKVKEKEEWRKKHAKGRFKNKEEEEAWKRKNKLLN